MAEWIEVWSLCCFTISGWRTGSSSVPAQKSLRTISGFWRVFPCSLWHKQKFKQYAGGLRIPWGWSWLLLGDVMHIVKPLPPLQPRQKWTHVLNDEIKGKQLAITQFLEDEKSVVLSLNPLEYTTQKFTFQWDRLPPWLSGLYVVFLLPCGTRKVFTSNFLFIMNISLSLVIYIRKLKQYVWGRIGIRINSFLSTLETQIHEKRRAVVHV